MAIVGSNERIPTTLPPDAPLQRGEAREWELGETALKVLKVIGVILVGASAICFIAGLEVPAVALLIVGAAALIFGFSCGTRATAALSNEVPTTNEAPATNEAPVTNEAPTAARSTLLSDALLAKIRAVPPAPARDEGTFEPSMFGAAGGLLAVDAWGAHGFTEISHMARSAARAVEQHRTTQSDQPLEVLFENNLKSSECHAERVARLFPPNGEGWEGKYILEREEQASYPWDRNLGALLGISTVGAIYYADINAVVEKSILFARVTGAGVMKVSVTTALSVAVALILQGHNSVEEIAEHTLNISQEVLRYELKRRALEAGEEESESVIKSALVEGDECLNAYIKGGRVQHGLQYFGDYLTNADDTALGLRAAFIALRKAKEYKDASHPNPFASAIRDLERTEGNWYVNGAAAGALVGAYLGDVSRRDCNDTISRDRLKLIQEHTARVALLSGAFPEEVAPSDAH